MIESAATWIISKAVDEAVSSTIAQGIRRVTAKRSHNFIQALLHELAAAFGVDDLSEANEILDRLLKDDDNAEVLRDILGAVALSRSRVTSTRALAALCAKLLRAERAPTPYEIQVTRALQELSDEELKDIVPRLASVVDKFLTEAQGLTQLGEFGVQMEWHDELKQTSHEWLIQPSTLRMEEWFGAYAHLVLSLGLGRVESVTASYLSEGNGYDLHRERVELSRFTHRVIVSEAGGCLVQLLGQVSIDHGA